MSDVAIAFHDVSKKFKKGQMFDSLRDLVPAVTRRTLARSGDRALGRNEFWVLKDINFEVSPGESVGIIGHNGAGKSTMLKHLTGIMKPTKGDIEVNGRLSALIEVGAGFHPDLTGRENIFLNGTILGMSRAEIRRKFDEIVSFSGLEEFIDTPVKRYSSGMHARLGFSVAAHLEPDILVVDEVLSVGDYVFQKKGLEKMRAVLESGATVMFVSHNLRAVSDLCTRAILLDHGKMVMDGPSQEVINLYYSQHQQMLRDNTEKEAYISAVTMQGSCGENLHFQSGDKVLLEIEIQGNRSCHDLSLSISIQDDEHNSIFDTSSERLTGKSFSLAEGESKMISFQLDLNLGPGTYYLAALIYRYDIQKIFDDLTPAKTLFVKTDRDVRGVANLFPTVVSR